ncbi:MAG: hypothetical protein HKO65_17295 [Gemmatimonadetes bacterium]|nr:hypothetical protein [Gemmatimonadota bacterium]NNM06855.1 hypothetical protein [Gemmatimonadota bacterium]
MSKDKTASVTERRASQDRMFRIAFGSSLLIHVLIFLFWRVVPIPPSPFSAAGPRAGDFYAAGGGMESVSLTVPPSRVIVPPRVPLISLEDIPVEFDMDPQLDLAAMTGEAQGRSDGPPGIEGGQGQGDGGTAAEGFFRVVPPTPRGMIMPPVNKNLRGKTLEVWVFVDATGRVVPDSTRLDPPTSDRGLNRQLIREAAEWVFNPAQRNNQPVASWYPYRVSG